KDLFDVAGVPTTAGSALRAQAVAKADSTVVSRLRAAGAVILGKSHTHEWALGTTSNNPHFGPARNPWDTDRIPGGSSGGNAAGLAARLFAGAVGSDTGGSVRIPAALCGVVGLKPTRGLVSLRGVVPLSWSLDHAGPMARTAEDAALLLDAIAGFDAGDPASRRPPEGPPVAPGLRGDPRGLAIGIPADYFWDEVVPEVAALCRQAVAVLEDAGARIVEVPPLGWRAAARASGRILLADAAAYHQATLAENAVAYGADVRARLETGLGLAGVDVARARREMDVWRRRLEDLFGHVDLLATPTTGNTAEPIAGIEGVAAAASLTARTSPFNLTGLPAASVPCGFTAAGLPVGLQLVGREWQEATVLRAAAAYQAVTEWHLRVPPVAAVTPPQGQH
ncbi:MAG: amidase, partial [Anaerolineae bacterium]